MHWNVASNLIGSRFDLLSDFYINYEIISGVEIAGMSHVFRVWLVQYMMYSVFQWWWCFVLIHSLWPVGGALEPFLVLESSRRSGAEPPIHPTPTSLAQTVFGIPKEIFWDKLR